MFYQKYMTFYKYKFLILIIFNEKPNFDTFLSFELMKISEYYFIVLFVFIRREQIDIK